MLLQQPPDIGILDVSSLTDSFLREKLAHHLLKIGVEPARQWDLESLFGPRQNFRRKERCEGFLQKRLQPSVAEPIMRRKAQGKLRHDVVAKRDPDLQRMRHAHA